MLDTPKKRAHPCRSLGKLVDDSRSTEYCLGPFYLYCSSSSGVRQAVKVPESAKQSRSRFRQAVKVPDPQLSPTTSVRLRNISSSSGSRRVRSHRSDSPVQFLSRSSFRSKNTSPFQIQPYESDPIDPTRFYSSVYGSKFQTGPRLITSVGGPIPGSRIHQVGGTQHKFRSEVRAGS